MYVGNKSWTMTDFMKNMLYYAYFLLRKFIKTLINL